MPSIATAPRACIHTTPKTWRRDGLEALRALAADPAVRALGETGLDFNRNYSPKPAQLAAFEAQLELACEIELPLFVHDRDASTEVHRLLARYRDRLAGVVVHCFTADGAALDAYLDIECHIGITGWVCDTRRGGALRALVPRIPTELLLVETDAPFLRPHNAPKARGRRNTPALLPYVIATLAELRGVEPESLAATTTQNARHLFGIV